MPELTVRAIEAPEKRSQSWRRWEMLVASNPASGIMQSLNWADFKKRQGLKHDHVGIFEGEQLIGGAILYCARRSNGAGILVAPEGPVLPWHDEARARRGLQLIMDRAQEWAQDEGIMAMRIEPRLAPPLPRLLREFGRAPVDLIPRETLYVDLTPEPAAILAAMKPKGRYNIKLSARHGVCVNQTNDPRSVAKFYAAVSQASRRDGFALEPLEFFEQLAETLCPSGQARFVFAEHEGDLLGAALLITYGQRATYLYGGITNIKRNLMGGYALQWAAMNAAREAGCSTYDFYGFDPFMAPQNQYARFSRFKSQFGGETIKLIGAQDHFFLDCLADAFVKAVNEAQRSGSKVEVRQC